MVKVILIAGLPGAGKTTYGKQLASELSAEFFDDFKLNAINDSSLFHCSRHYHRLTHLLKTGKPCVVTDIDFCNGQSREEAETRIRENVPDVDVQWRFFANDPEKCLENVRKRKRTSVLADETMIRKYSNSYRFPNGAMVIPVVGCVEEPTKN